MPEQAPGGSAAATGLLGRLTLDQTFSRAGEHEPVAGLILHGVLTPAFEFDDLKWTSARRNDP